jgi:hypothetical protein
LICSSVGATTHKFSGKFSRLTNLDNVLKLSFPNLRSRQVQSTALDDLLGLLKLLDLSLSRGNKLGILSFTILVGPLATLVLLLVLLKFPATLAIDLT